MLFCMTQERYIPNLKRRSEDGMRKIFRPKGRYPIEWGKKKQALCAAVLCVLFGGAGVFCVAERVSGAEEGAIMAAAGFALPDGAVGILSGEVSKPESESSSSLPSKETSSVGSTEKEETSSQEQNTSSKSSEESSESSAPAGNETNLPDGAVEASITGSIQELTIANTGVQFENIWVQNRNEYHDIDIEKVLGEQPSVKPLKNGQPEILIYHTHTTEAYQGVSRTQDETQNMVAIGEEITKELEAAGYGVIHDTTCHDYPSYNGSYNRSYETIAKNLEKYPTIQVTLDIHRDALGAETKLKPTAVVDGKKAAQIMIISGCDDDGTLGFPDWEYNLRFAMRIQKEISDSYPSLARPLNFCARKYNEHMTRGSLLIEIGTDMNTLEEAKYSGSLLGKSLASVLDDLAEK